MKFKSYLMAAVISTIAIQGHATKAFTRSKIPVINVAVSKMEKALTVDFDFNSSDMIVFSFDKPVKFVRMIEDEEDFGQCMENKMIKIDSETFLFSYDMNHDDGGNYCGFEIEYNGTKHAISFGYFIDD